MFRNILLMVLIAVNIASMIPFYLNASIDYFSINVIITAITLIVCTLYLIIRTTRLNLTLTILTVIVALIHASMLVMQMYDYVYA